MNQPFHWSNADYIDSMSDYLAEQQEAMYETNPEDWIGYVEEEDYRGAIASFLYNGDYTSVEEKYAYNHQSKPYVS